MSFLDIYPKIPVRPASGNGVYIEDIEGKRYMDLISGLGVNLLGYADSDLRKIIESDTPITHVSNLYRYPLREEIASKLNRLCNTDNVFFTNSGTESVEGAIKFAWKSNPGKILAFKDSFHGRSLGSYSVSDLINNGGFPVIDAPVEFIDRKNPEDLENKLQGVTIVIYEPIQGASGVHEIGEDVSDILKTLQEKGVILIADEIQSGLGRTGEFLASTHFNLEPDIVVLAKGIGGGLPLGAICMKDSIGRKMKQGDHGTTMGGNIIALKLAGVVLDRIENYLLEHIKNLEEKIVNRYRSILNLRGKGLFLGFDVPDAGRFSEQMLEEGYLVNRIGNKKIRLLPPYIITDSELESFFKKSEEILE